MAIIRLANSCNNCENILETGRCTVHGVKVSHSYTCDAFDMKASLQDDRNCLTCIRYETDNCANPQKAAPGMLCSHWAPKNVAWVTGEFKKRCRVSFSGWPYCYFPVYKANSKLLIFNNYGNNFFATSLKLLMNFSYLPWISYYYHPWFTHGKSPVLLAK